MFKIGRSKPQPPKQPEEVKCADCGFLSVKMTVKGEFGEVEGERRERWAMPKKLSGKDLHGVFAHENTPRCFRRTYPLQGEISFVYDVERGLNEAVWATTHKERPCSTFMEWRQGYSPKEHLDIMNERQLRIDEIKERRTDRSTLWWQLLVTAIVGGLIAALL